MEQVVSTAELLLAGPGVRALEKTYQTDYRGHWLLVVENDKITDLGEYITQNVVCIYGNRNGKKPKVVPDQSNSQQKGYRLFLIDKSLVKVGTYAEVLPRQFASTPIKEKSTEVHFQPKVHAQMERKESFPRNDTKGQTNIQTTNTTNTRGIPGNHLEQNQTESYMNNNGTIWDDDNPPVKKDTEMGVNEKYNEVRGNRSSTYEKKTPFRQMSNENTATRMEEIFQAKLEEMTTINQKIMKAAQQ